MHDSMADVHLRLLEPPGSHPLLLDFERFSGGFRVWDAIKGLPAADVFETRKERVLEIAKRQDVGWRPPERLLQDALFVVAKSWKGQHSLVRVDNPHGPETGLIVRHWTRLDGGWKHWPPMIALGGDKTGILKPDDIDESEFLSEACMRASAQAWALVEVVLRCLTSPADVVLH